MCFDIQNNLNICQKINAIQFGLRRKICIFFFQLNVEEIVRS